MNNQVRFEKVELITSTTRVRVKLIEAWEGKIIKTLKRLIGNSKEEQTSILQEV